MSFVFKILFVSSLFLVSHTASADILDRINECEENNGGSCIFDLLRELASKESINIGNKVCYVVQNEKYSPLESDRRCLISGNYPEKYCVFAYEFNTLIPSSSSFHYNTSSDWVKNHRPIGSAEEAAAVCKKFLSNQ